MIYSKANHRIYIYVAGSTSATIMQSTRSIMWCGFVLPFIVSIYDDDTGYQVLRMIGSSYFYRYSSPVCRSHQGRMVGCCTCDTILYHTIRIAGTFPFTLFIRALNCLPIVRMRIQTPFLAVYFRMRRGGVQSAFFGISWQIPSFILPLGLLSLISSSSLLYYQGQFLTSARNDLSRSILLARVIYL